MSERSWNRPRQSDIAKEAGVSIATVSYVLNDRPGVPNVADATRERVLEAARRLGYVANPAARSLARGSNRLIGIYTFEAVFPVDHHDFYHPFFVGMEEEAARQSYDIVMFTSATGPDGRRSIYRGGINKLAMADGCVLLGKNAGHEELTRLRDDGFPFVFIGRREVPGDAINYVAADYATATTQVVGHLARLGHRRVAYLGAASPGEYSADRDAGFWSAVERHQLDVSGLECPVDLAGPSRSQLRSLLDGGATAMVVHEATVAIKVIAMLKDDGVTVPGDCSVVALNDPPDDDPAGEPLTCFHIPRREMGETAVQMLLRRLDSPDEPPEVSVLECEFDPGRTSGAA